MIKEVEDEIIKEKEGGRDVSEAEALIKKAKDDFESKRYRSAKEATGEAKKLLGVIWEKTEASMKKEVVMELQQAWSKIKMDEAAGVGVAESKEFIDTARIALLKKEYKKASVFLKQSIRKLEEAKASHKEIGNIIRNGEEAIVELREEGVFTGELEDLLARIKVEFEEKKYNVAGKYAKDFNKLLERIVKKAKSEEIKVSAKERELIEVIQNLESKLSKAKRLGIDITGAERSVKLAREALNISEYKKALDFIQESMDKFVQKIPFQPEVQKDSPKEEIIEMIYSIESKLSIGKGMGIDTSVSEKILEEAQDAIKTNDYLRALDIAKQTLDEFEHEISSIKRTN
jgi:hypothetical protein